MTKLKTIFIVLSVLLMLCASKWQSINQMKIASKVKSDSQNQISCCKVLIDCSDIIKNLETTSCDICQIGGKPSRLIPAYQLKLPANNSFIFDSTFYYQKTPTSYFQMDAFFIKNIKWNESPLAQDLLSSPYLRIIHTTLLLI